MTGYDEVQGVDEIEHTHRWRIEAQGTATSVGLCACGAERAFNNGWSGGNPSWVTGRRARPTRN